MYRRYLEILRNLPRHFRRYRRYLLILRALTYQKLRHCQRLRQILRRLHFHRHHLFRR